MAIASHIVLDTIGTDESATFTAGGPPCYAGLTCRRFGAEVLLVTKVGADLPGEVRSYLDFERLLLRQEQVVSAHTTRFSLSTENGSRRLVLQSKCEPLSVADVSDVKADCWIVSPVYDEVPPEVLAAIKSNPGKKRFVMLDPQGYVRQADPSGRITIRSQAQLDLSGIAAMKVDSDEMRALTGGLDGLDGMLELQRRGVEFVVSTVPNEVHLLHKSVHYWAKIKEVDTPDSTGAGDILCGAFCCAYMKEKDPLWALCFGAGALKAALETRRVGVDKIPQFPRVEENASYFYNTVGFKQLS